jgi:hypothetical protein
MLITLQNSFLGPFFKQFFQLSKKTHKLDPILLKIGLQFDDNLEEFFIRLKENFGLTVRNLISLEESDNIKVDINNLYKVLISV